MAGRNSRNNIISDEIPYIQDIHPDYKIYNFNDLIKPENNGKTLYITSVQAYTYDFSNNSSDLVAIAFNKAKNEIIDRAKQSDTITNFRANNNPIKEDRMSYEKELAAITSEVYENIEIEGRGRVFAESRTEFFDDVYNARTDVYENILPNKNQPLDFVGPPTEFPIYENFHLNDTEIKSDNMCTHMAIEEGWLLQSAENELLPKQPDNYSGSKNYQYQTNYHLMGGMADDNISDGVEAGEHVYIMSESTSSIIESTISGDKNHALNYMKQLNDNYEFADAIAGEISITKLTNRGKEIHSIYGNPIHDESIIADRKEKYLQAKKNNDINGLKSLDTHGNLAIIQSYLFKSQMDQQLEEQAKHVVTIEQNKIINNFVESMKDFDLSISDEDINNLGELSAQLKEQGNDKVADRLNNIAKD